MALIDDTRLEGFFPIQLIESLESEVAHWDGHCWRFVGTSETLQNENEILKIGRRIDVDGLIMQGGFWS